MRSQGLGGQLVAAGCCQEATGRGGGQGRACQLYLRGINPAHTSFEMVHFLPLIMQISITN